MGLAWYLAPVNDKIVQTARGLLGKPGVDHAKLRQIINGKVKTIDVRWWRQVHGIAPGQLAAKVEKSFKKRLAALKAMADPARNPNAPERRAAEAALAKAQAAGPPKPPRPRSAPGLEDYDREFARRYPPPPPLPSSLDEWVRTTRFGAKPRQRHAAKPVNTTKPRSAATAAKPEPPPVNTTKQPRPTANVNTTKPARPPPKLVNTTKPSKPRSADRHLEPNKDRHRPGYMTDYMRRWRAAEREGR